MGRRIAIVALVAVITVVVVALLVLRHFTSPSFIEEKIRVAMAADGPYIVHVASSSFNPIRRSFVAHDISMAPDTLAGADDSVRTRVWLRASSVRAGGLAFSDFRKGISVASVQIDSPRVEIYRDRKIPSARKPVPPPLPHEQLKQIDRRIRIAGIHVTNGDLSYSERDELGTRAGTFRFTEIGAVINNVTNDTTRMKTPCTIVLRTKLAGSGLMQASFDYNLAPRGLDMTYNGSVGKMGALALNELLVDLEGIRVTGGTIDTTSFAFEVKDDVAVGAVRVLYRDVGFQVQDMNTGEQGVSDHLATFMSDMKMRSSNPDEKETSPIVVSVRRERDPYHSLIQFVWLTIRDGLLLTLGVQD